MAFGGGQSVWKGSTSGRRWDATPVSKTQTLDASSLCCHHRDYYCDLSLAPSRATVGLAWRAQSVSLRPRGPCHTLSCLVLSCPRSTLLCSALLCPALPCPALPCPALPCPALPFPFPSLNPDRCGARNPLAAAAVLPGPSIPSHLPARAGGYARRVGMYRGRRPASQS
ncbi:hypothetical protein K431DRAFT_43626 [Polychaeton citri CBS 116435]|uniref:Uncharacterized protein n=1 Tax=Polychaeton citri CBS 116435 TaxID=1314669 RepID=A0A9P4URK2_9PEZI|nr:hypothetical protein K431DRAFT_43626 [Polychaeton citri CBS 116435]